MSNNKIILKCGACGTIGEEKEFENEYGKQICSWCDSDVWLNTVKDHELANR